jgi:hypothetical protein
MRADHIVAVFCSAIGIALLVVSLAFPAEHRIVKVKREPIYVRVQDSPWAPMPEVEMAGHGRPVEP